MGGREKVGTFAEIVELFGVDGVVAGVVEARFRGFLADKRRDAVLHLEGVARREQSVLLFIIFQRCLCVGFAQYV